MLVGVVGAKGAPGATTTALALGLAGTRRSILIEADPDGGTIGARLGLRLDPGLGSLAAAARHELDPQLFAEHLQPLGHRLVALLGPSDPRAMRPALGIVAEQLAAVLRTFAEVNAIVDLGRLNDDSPVRALAREVDLLAWAASPSLEGMDGLAVRLAGCSELHEHSVLITIGDGPYHPNECSEAVGLRLAGHLPCDEAGAAALWRDLSLDRVARRPFGRAVAQLANTIDISNGGRDTSRADESRADEDEPSAPAPLAEGVR